MNVTDLNIGDFAFIKNIADNSQDLYHLLELGFLPGEKIIINKIAPLGCPIEVNVMNYNICIRKNEAQSIFIHK